MFEQLAIISVEQELKHGSAKKSVLQEPNKFTVRQMPYRTDSTPYEATVL